MKVVYYSPSFFADCDFPLINALQLKGVDVRYYIPISRGFQKSSIIELDRPYKRWGIYKACSIEDMKMYKECIDLEKLYFISGFSNNFFLKYTSNILLWIWTMLHMFFQRADVMHITWQLKYFEKILYYIPFGGKKVLTVHDPIQHSGKQDYEYNEKARLRCYSWADSFILLNSIQVQIFSTTYNIPLEKINISHLGVYDSVASLDVIMDDTPRPYILFFGQITPYKGVEYLLEAMSSLHDHCPNVDLVIAGGGKLYFDIEPYKKEYIIWKNHYIGIRELKGLISRSLFAVCPYKDATQSGVVQTAFALETPVIATNVGSLSQIVCNEEYGIIVPPCDSDALARAMLDLINNPSKLQRMRDNIKNRWLPSMSWDPIADKYIQIYDSNNSHY